MVGDHRFNVAEIRLATLRRMSLGLTVGMVMCLVIMAGLLLVSVVVAPKVPEALGALLVAVPFLLGFIGCLVWLPKTKDEFAELRRWQKNIYLLRRRKEWRDRHDCIATPDWNVVDKWEKGRHFYGLVEAEDINGEPKRWYEPLRKPQARRANSKNVKR